MPDEQAREKWNRRYAQATADSTVPARVLTEYAYLLPTTGTALDLACGRGGNALFLARRGFKVHAWDISQEAIDQLEHQCETEGLHVETVARDVHENPPKASTFDVICVSYFLEREIADAIFEALCPDGLLFYQTFVSEKVTDEGPGNPKYRLEQNELLSLFASLHVLSYQELGRVGNTGKGVRDTAWLVAQKR